MSLYPDVQKKAYTELHRVVGAERLPDFGDYEKLVYIQAIVIETMRWLPVTPLILPHRVTTDDVYRDFHIPKGATVLAVRIVDYVRSLGYLHSQNMYRTPGKLYTINCDVVSLYQKVNPLCLC